MPLIKKLDSAFGKDNPRVNFSTRHNRFEIICDYPLGYKSIGKLISWSDVELELKRIIESKIYTEKYIGKYIGISFESTSTKNDKSVQFVNNNMVGDVGFRINWYILDKFKGERNDTFKIIEEHNGSSRSLIGRHDILGQLFFSDDVKLFEYTDEMCDFLINTTDKMRTLIDEFDKFFTTDKEQFILNIKTQKLLS